MTNWGLRGEQAIGALKYLIAGFMMLAGVLTCFADLEPMNGALGYIYNTRISLVTFGLIFFTSGAMLLYGKIRRSRKWTGHGLFAIFACFLFSAVLETYARHSLSIGNFVAALVLAALYLRWRFKTAYINPAHFSDDVDRLGNHEPD